MVMGWSAQLVLLVALTLANNQLLAALEPRALRYCLAFVSAGFLSIGLITLWRLVWRYGRGEGSLTTMLRRSRAGEAPVDGRVMIATGRVSALSAPLTAPLSGVACVAYRYRIFKIEEMSDGNRVVPVF